MDAEGKRCCLCFNGGASAFRVASPSPTPIPLLIDVHRECMYTSKRGELLGTLSAEMQGLLMATVGIINRGIEECKRAVVDAVSKYGRSSAELGQDITRRVLQGDSPRLVEDAATYTRRPSIENAKFYLYLYNEHYLALREVKQGFWRRPAKVVEVAAVPEEDALDSLWPFRLPMRWRCIGFGI